MLFRFLSILFLIGCAFIASAQSPVQGDDLLQCLGKPRGNELVAKLNNYIGNKENKDEISFMNYGKGIQVSMERTIVKSIDLYNDKNPYSPEIKKFDGALPLGINFENTIHQVKQKIGEGYETSGEAISSFQLIKVMRLNENDDYRLLAEFNSGRMIMLSLVFLEGGAGAEEDSVSVKKGTAGFTGNDFFTMMKKNIYNYEFTRFRQLLNYPEVDNRKRKLFVKDGVDVQLNESGGIQSITLYSGGQKSDFNDLDFQPYVFDLPYGLRMENTKSGIIKKLGPPVSDSGNVAVYKERNAEIEIRFSGEKIDLVKIKIPEKTAP